MKLKTQEQQTSIVYFETHKQTRLILKLSLNLELEQKEVCNLAHKFFTRPYLRTVIKSMDGQSRLWFYTHNRYKIIDRHVIQYILPFYQRVCFNPNNPCKVITNCRSLYRPSTLPVKLNFIQCNFYLFFSYHSKIDLSVSLSYIGINNPYTNIMAPQRQVLN